jgi:serine/threonine-protein phosphatase PP1 catalytic subunit
LGLKIKYPEHIFLLRGRHETRELSRICGLHDECKRAELDAGVWKLFNKCFDCLPVAAIIGERILAVPRGLSPDLHHLELIRRLRRPLMASFEFSHMLPIIRVLSTNIKPLQTDSRFRTRL